MSKNLLLKKARKEKGWSQKLLADFAVVSLSTIERAERGEPLRIDNVERICKCLERTPQELGLVQLEQEVPLATLEVRNKPNFTPAAISMNSLMSNYQGIMLPTSARGDHQKSVSLLPQSYLDFGILDRLERALMPQPQVDITMLDYLQSVVSSFKRQLVQGRQTNWPGLLTTAINQLGLYTSLLESRVERNEPIMLLIGETCLLIGDVLFNMHDYNNAKRYYQMALGAAQDAPNVALYAITSGRYGLLLIDCEEYKQAEQLLSHAIHLAEQNISSIVCSWLWAVKAEAHAGKQEEKPCYEALESAKAYLGMNDERMACYTFDAELIQSVYGTTKLFGFEGACYLRLKQPKQAQRVLATSQKLSLHAHHQSLIHVDFAQSFIQQAAPQEACAFASQALDYIQQTGSQRALQRVLSIRQDLQPWDSLPAVQELDERITLFAKKGA